ncbi:MAG: Flp pilus assembly complex ATPase component [Lentisphaerae bacterium]|nr:Flp pilus assembly complex ATPase component [Lentisphaerota bacterium]MCP4101670.1 Flp pilus assembly complex ATPase component [Lentisphaerota bacterium]
MLDPESLALKDILMAEGICTEEQLQDVEDEHDRTGKKFSEVVINYGFLDNESLLEVIANSLGSEVFDLKLQDLPRNVVDMLDPETARAYGVIPVDYDDSLLKVVSKNPLNFQITEELQFILGHDVMILVADESNIDTAIEKYYPTSIATVNDVLSEMGDTQDEYNSDEDIESAANETPIVRFVDVILYQAIKDQASDIHFEPFEKNFRIRYRVDGALYEMPEPPKSLAIPVISRLKIMSNLNISERRLPQDGRIELKIGGKPIDLRVSCLPTSYGESVVLRILDRSVVNLSLDSLGMGQDVLENLREMVHRPNGILLVTGPTGSGKSTTLYSCLNEINEIGEKLLTSEDPVEYDIEGIMQVPINEGVGMTFHKALRAFLRQDPDRIMLGEIRDLETAKMAIESSLTGHFVLSTLHTNEAAATVTRLSEMGIEPFLICSSVVGVLSQRLIRRVCPHCKESYEPTDDELERMRVTRETVGNRKFYYGKGCQACTLSGYKSRKAICELLVMSKGMTELISKSASTAEIREKAAEEGMRLVREDGIMAILNGETTVDEVLRYT